MWIPQHHPQNPRLSCTAGGQWCQNCSGPGAVAVQSEQATEPHSPFLLEAKQGENVKTEITIFLIKKKTFWPMTQLGSTMTSRSLSSSSLCSSPHVGLTPDSQRGLPFAGERARHALAGTCRRPTSYHMLKDQVLGHRVLDSGLPWIFINDSEQICQV